jgi:rubredoxin/uncharacterized membrane protein
MSPLTRCKVCGFVMAENKLKDKCPACGAPRSVFEPFVDRISWKRRRFLDLNIHPIAVHFPQAFASSLLVLTIAPLVFRGTLRDLFVSTAKVLSLFLPLLVAASMLVGYFDAKFRLKKIRKSPILIKKITYSCLFLVFSVTLALLIWFKGLSSPGASAGGIILALGSFVSSFFLGFLGSQLLQTAMPGD